MLGTIYTIHPTIKPLSWFSLIQLDNLARDCERHLAYNYSWWHVHNPDQIEIQRHDIAMYRAEIARRFPNYSCPHQRRWAARQAQEDAQ